MWPSLETRPSARPVSLTVGGRLGNPLGLFDGIPLSVKDLAPVKDAPFTAGLRPLKDQIAGVDATHVRRFREAGAVILG
jgi:aspartyl-tRNA(Asn)/glutamyl-tRNA(Gln) amidotransferase subunit A